MTSQRSVFVVLRSSTHEPRGVIGAVLLSLCSACAGGDPTNLAPSEPTTTTKEAQSIDIDCPRSVPANLVPPSGNKLKLRLHVVKGTQDYACVNDAFSLQNPEAVLKNGRPADDSHHFFGAPGSPLFVSDRDGSEVDLEKIAASPAAGTIPWLLLQTVAVADAQNGRPGLFSDVTFVQRLNTQGGNAPPGACNVGEIVKVPYVADYFFYEKGDGATCH
jgi:hypothetical protein